METIRLLLVDDHDVIRTGLRSFLETQDDLEVVGEACNGIEAIATAKEHQPDVIIMDITMPEMDGLEATRHLSEICPNCNVLALTVHEDKQYFFEMMAAGATGYITKQAAADELVSGIRTVHAGNVYLQPTLAKWLLEDYRRLIQHPMSEDSRKTNPESHPDLDVLSDRERQVLEMVADGLSTPRIAEELEISPKTVSRHRERIMNKLNLHSATELVKFAIRTGLISV
ncbi:MAG: response regulator transcription factor [Anaerolineales bacterium]|nr:response regulator transcription factor [Chloroflexota bacterium]MBL6979941.1 response regulator transcription factor [Anaerolineales bacterium]